MENFGSNSDVPTGPPTGVSGEAWLRKLLGYVNTMRTSFPNASHPPDDWLTDGAKSYSSSQNSSAVGHSSAHLDLDIAGKIREDVGQAYQKEHRSQA